MSPRPPATRAVVAAPGNSSGVVAPMKALDGCLPALRSADPRTQPSRPLLPARPPAWWRPPSLAGGLGLLVCQLVQLAHQAVELPDLILHPQARAVGTEKVRVLLLQFLPHCRAARRSGAEARDAIGPAPRGGRTGGGRRLSLSPRPSVSPALALRLPPSVSLATVRAPCGCSFGGRGRTEVRQAGLDVGLHLERVDDLLLRHVQLQAPLDQLLDLLAAWERGSNVGRET